MQWTPQAVANKIGRPRGVRGVLVRSTDGSFVDQSGSSRGLSGPADLMWLLVNRALAKTLYVSYGTAIREAYPSAWRPRAEFETLRKDQGLPNELPVVVVSDSADRRNRATSAGFEVIDLQGFLQAAQHETSCVCEGGPTLIDALAAAGALSELAWTVSPAIVGVTESKQSDFPALEHWLAKSQVAWLVSQDNFEFSIRRSSNHYLT